ncbi:MAG: cytochrome P450, partial [Actinoallomurus sp.]
GPSMLSLDGPSHTRHRDPFARTFRPAETRARFTAFVQAEVDRRVTALEPAGRAELRAELAGPLAVAVVAEALGLGDTDATTIRSWYEELVSAVSAITAGQPATTPRAYSLLRSRVEEAIKDDRPSSLLAEVAGRPEGLTTAEVVADTAVLMFGGIDTTEGMITNAAAHLLGHPGRFALVQAEPALLTGAIEESVRLEPAASVIDRYAVRDVRLGDAAIRTGDLVRVSIAGANRDPDVFADPDRYDIRREGADRHLSFARGPHFCFGAHLARLETFTALNALLRLEDLRLDGAPDRAAPRGLVFRKPGEVRVRWD